MTFCRQIAIQKIEDDTNKIDKYTKQCALAKRVMFALDNTYAQIDCLFKMIRKTHICLIHLSIRLVHLSISLIYLSIFWYSEHP